MISLHCTQCQQLLEMDEGFAGGVCRCQYCGTIQTVPSHLKDQHAASSAAPAPKPTKALYKKGASTGQSGTGLEDLAEIVASSGLARGSLAKPPRTTTSTRTIPPRRNPMLPALIGAGVLVVILLVLVVYFAMRSGDKPDPAGVTRPDGTRDTTSVGKGSGRPKPDDGDAAPAPAPPRNTGPSFAGVPLPSGPVVYLIDRSQANADIFDTAKAAAYASARSLGPSRQFRIIFWHHGVEGVISYPESGLALATPAEIEAADKRFADIIAYEKTELQPALERAVKSNPDHIVLVTAKGFQLDEAYVPMVKQVIKSRPVPVHTIALGGEASEVLQQIAKQTGGEYREVSYEQLGTFAR